MPDAPSEGESVRDPAGASGAQGVGASEGGAVGGAGTASGTGKHPPWQPGVSGNPAGSSTKSRFKAAVTRALKRVMREFDEDEYDQAGDKLVELAFKGREKVSARMLLELYAREDGPIVQRVAGPEGEPLSIVMELRDTREQKK